MPRLCRRHDTLRSEIGHGEKVSRRLWSKKPKEEIDCVARRRGAERSEARGVLELERVVSCRSGNHRWRTKFNFGSGEPFDDLHRSTALRAAPKIGTVVSGRGVLFGWTRVVDLRDQNMARELCQDMRENGMRLGVVDTLPYLPAKQKVGSSSLPWRAALFRVRPGDMGKKL